MVVVAVAVAVVAAVGGEGGGGGGGGGGGIRSMSMRIDLYWIACFTWIPAKALDWVDSCCVEIRQYDE